MSCFQLPWLHMHSKVVRFQLRRCLCYKSIIVSMTTTTHQPSNVIMHGALSTTWTKTISDVKHLLMKHSCPQWARGTRRGGFDQYVDLSNKGLVDAWWYTSGHLGPSPLSLWVSWLFLFKFKARGIWFGCGESMEQVCDFKWLDIGKDWRESMGGPTRRFLGQMNFLESSKCGERGVLTR